MMSALSAPLDSILLFALEGAGVFAVGGQVRDQVLMGIGRPQPPSPDYDYLVTNMPLDVVLTRLANVGRAEMVGASFGVIKFSRDGTTVDLALPRRERSTGPHHRDFAIESGPDVTIEEDLARRDFRINMLARDLRSGAILDPYGGEDDLIHNRLDALREEAFVEDPLRVIRGAQLSARFDLTPTSFTLGGMRRAAPLIATIAPERLADELTKLLERSRIPSIGFELLREVGALHQVLPELMEGWEIEQNEYHRFSVYYHSLECCDKAIPELSIRLAALLHDIGKPRTKEGPHFYRHEFVGADMSRVALERLRFPHDLIDRVCRLVAAHMYQADDALSDAAIRRFIRRVTPNLIEPLFELRHADVAATGLPPRDPEAQRRFEDRVRMELSAAPPFGVHDLAIDGEAVIAVMRELGIVDERFVGDSRVGVALRQCLEEVLDDPRKNEPDVLLGIVRSFFAPAT